jgi:site-specific recombinase XerD
MATAAKVAYIDPYWQLWDEFSRNLKAEGRSPHTLRVYGHALRSFREYLDAEGLPTDPVQVRKGHIERYLGSIRQTHSQATVKARFTGLAAWFNWMEREQVIERSPAYRVPAPRVAEKPTPVLSAEQLGRLLKACSGTRFEDRRDVAMFRLFVDTGLRRQEMARLALEDLDRDSGLLSVLLKGDDTHLVPFGAKASRDLDRYLRLRARHRLAAMTVERDRDQGGARELVHPLWLSAHGGLTGDGIYAVTKRRAIQAGIDPHAVHVHTFRHSFAHSLKSAGASDEDVQRLGRWKDSKMVRRYGAALSQQRAWETHRRLSPGDRL